MVTRAQRLLIGREGNWRFTARSALRNRLRSARTTQFGTGDIVALRFRDWTGLGVAERAQFSATAKDLARRLEPRLNAFVMFENGPITPARGVLGGMPYAAKDIFVSATRLPHGGLSAPMPISNTPTGRGTRSHGSRRGHRIGYTAMTELAYEPSGYNAVHGRVGNPWNLDFITGGSSSGSAAAVASGSVVVALGPILAVRCAFRRIVAALPPGSRATVQCLLPARCRLRRRSIPLASWRAAPRK